MNESSAIRRKLWFAWSLALVVLAIGGALSWQGRLLPFEREMFEAINGLSIGGWLDVAARLVSDLVWLAVFVVLAAFLFVKRIRRHAWGIGALAVGTYLVTYIVEHIVARARPEDLAVGQELLMRATQDGFGYPSGHTAVIAVIALGLWPYLRQGQRITVVTLVVAVALSRIYLGVHFPLDIIGGLAVAVIVWASSQLLSPRVRQKLYLDSKSSK